MEHQAFAELLGNYGEFVGAIGVVATLAYLAVQIRQNTASVQQSNRIGIANTEISVRGGYGSLSRMITENADVAAAFVQAQSEDGDLDDVTQLRLHYFFVQMANQWHAMEIAFEQDMIPQRTKLCLTITGSSSRHTLVLGICSAMCSKPGQRSLKLPASSPLIGCSKSAATDYRERL